LKANKNSNIKLTDKTPRFGEHHTK
jgi:hypothetical protein